MEEEHPKKPAAARRLRLDRLVPATPPSSSDDNDDDDDDKENKRQQQQERPFLVSAAATKDAAAGADGAEQMAEEDTNAAGAPLPATTAPAAARSSPTLPPPSPPPPPPPPLTTLVIAPEREAYLRRYLGRDEYPLSLISRIEAFLLRGRYPTFGVGEFVEVRARTLPGECRLGGLGHVTAVHPSKCVRYLVGRMGLREGMVWTYSAGSVTSHAHPSHTPCDPHAMPHNQKQTTSTTSGTRWAAGSGTWTATSSSPARWTTPVGSAAAPPAASAVGPSSTSADVTTGGAGRGNGASRGGWRRRQL